MNLGITNGFTVNQPKVGQNKKNPNFGVSYSFEKPAYLKLQDIVHTNQAPGAITALVKRLKGNFAEGSMGEPVHIKDVLVNSSGNLVVSHVRAAVDGLKDGIARIVPNPVERSMDPYALLAVSKHVES